MINNNIMVIIVILCLLIGVYLFLSEKNKEGFDSTTNIISLSNVNLADDSIAINTLAQIARDLMIDNNLKIKGSYDIRDNIVVGGNTTIQGKATANGNLNVMGNFNLLPRGIIVAWNNISVPAGWTVCDGNNGTPDLQGKFILTANNSNDMNTTGGKDVVTLTVEQLPSHNHNTNGKWIMTGGGTKYRGGEYGAWMNSNDMFRDEGGGGAHNNMPPYFVLLYIMKL